MSHTTITIYKLKKQGFDFGLKDYPIYDESHREELNEKLLNEYLFEEIGQETPDMFRLYLNRAMAKIMPYYNELYKTAALDLDILNQYDLKEDHSINKNENENAHEDTSGTSTLTDTATSTANGKKTAIVSRPPQHQIQVDSLENGVYARDATFSKDSSDTTTNDSSSTETSTNKDNTFEKTGNENGTASKTGRDKPVSELINAARESILNIDRMIIEDPEIDKLFYGLYF